jgi:uncharacterized membrane protein YjjP (DUF1212 family)
MRRKAILACNKLSHSFQTKRLELKMAASGVKCLSSNDAIDGCIACIDGFLLKIKVPTTSDFGNVKSFFHGHY